MYSPGWLFLLPGLVLLFVGLLGVLLTATGSREIGGVTLDIGTLVVSSSVVAAGVQLVIFHAVARSFAMSLQLLPPSAGFDRWIRRFTLERGVVIGVLLVLLGIIGIGSGLIRWQDVDFGDLDAGELLRVLVPSMLAVVVGLQFVFGSFLLGIAQLGVDRPPIAPLDDERAPAETVPG
jgi:uncharacterized membrane protein YidH (DUF202 family)